MWAIFWHYLNVWSYLCLCIFSRKYLTLIQFCFMCILHVYSEIPEHLTGLQPNNESMHVCLLISGPLIFSVPMYDFLTHIWLGVQCLHLCTLLWSCRNFWPCLYICPIGPLIAFVSLHLTTRGLPVMAASVHANVPNPWQYLWLYVFP